MEWLSRLEISVKHPFYGQEKIARRFTKKLETVKTELQWKISKYLKSIKFRKKLTNRFLYTFSLVAKITSKLFIVSANWREKKRLNRPVCEENNAR